MNSLVDNIKAIADKRGMNLKDVALKADLSENAIYNWDNSSPKLNSVQKVADVLGVSVDRLNGRDNQDLEPNQKLVAYSIDPDITDEEREAIIKMVQEAMKLKKQL
ncbi:helix-turn-helix domain-containing protein [Oenococcus sicerae]|uniref:helix-turn-helix domain-containing protein n=1 Tax=Oenococcus sicerae TaxID=2203724 RepID=UPI0039E748CD